MRNGILVSLTAMVASSGIALGQGYYPGYPPQGYYPPRPAPGWQMPMQQMPMASPWSQGQPQMPAYAQPNYPVVRNLGTLDGRQYPGVMMPAPAQAAPAPMAVSPSATANESVVLLPTYTPTENVPVFATVPNATTAAPARKFLIKRTGGQAENPEPQVDAAKASLEVMEEGGCADGSCKPPPPPIPDREPGGYCSYARVEGLYWWFGREGGAALAALTTPRGTTLLRPGDLINNQFLGARVTLGCWCDPQQYFGVEASGFYTGTRDVHTALTTAVAISRPFFNLATMKPALAVLPAGSSADIGAHMDFYGGELNGRCEICRWGFGHVDLLAGIRFLDLEENLNVTTATPAAVTTDDFSTRNRFWGAQLGVDAEVNCGPFFLGAYAKIAGGAEFESVRISGQTVVPMVSVTPGGFLAQASNMGLFQRTHFGLLPETGLSFGMRLSDHMRIFGSYTLLYLMNAVRPGDQIDRNINFVAAAPPGPLFRWNDTTFWAQGISGGLEVRY